MNKFSNQCDGCIYFMKNNKNIKRKYECDLYALWYHYVKGETPAISYEKLKQGLVECPFRENGTIFNTVDELFEDLNNDE